MCHIWLFAVGWCNLRQTALNSKITALKINNTRTKQPLNFGAKLATRAIINIQKSLAKIWLSDNVSAFFFCLHVSICIVVAVSIVCKQVKRNRNSEANYFVYSMWMILVDSFLMWVWRLSCIRHSASSSINRNLMTLTLAISINSQDSYTCQVFCKKKSMPAISCNFSCKSNRFEILPLNSSGHFFFLYLKYLSFTNTSNEPNRY